MLNKFFAVFIVLVVTTDPIWASESNDAPRSKHRRQKVLKAEVWGARHWGLQKSGETKSLGVRVKEMPKACLTSLCDLQYVHLSFSLKSLVQLAHAER